MTAHELVVYIRGAAKHRVEHAWWTARLALEGMSKRGLRSLQDVLEPYRSPDEQAHYNEMVELQKLKSFIDAHNAAWIANHGG